MILEQYIEQERKIRQKVHFHGGVWWKQSSFQSCQPLYPLQEIPTGSSRPGFTKALIRYSHLVPPGSVGKIQWDCMFLEEDALAGFSFEGLKHEKRKAVNRGKRSGLKVERIENIENHWPDLQQIYISTANRTSYGLPGSYYVENEDDWKTNLKNEFDLVGRDWFGVFSEDTLVGFLYSCLVDGTASLLVTKYNDDYRNMRPTDFLHYHVILNYQDHPKCHKIYAGRSVTATPTIDRFKSAFGFKRIPIQAFECVNRFVMAGAKSALFLGKPILQRIQADNRRGIGYRLKVLENSIHRMAGKDG